MLLEVVPTAEERRLLLEFGGDVGSLERPEQLLRTLACIPRLEGRLRAMRFKAQLEIDLEELMLTPVAELGAACEAVGGSQPLHALLQVVLDVGNALNAGTAKGNAVGFKLTTLLKLAELKAKDKKTTLLTYVLQVVRANAPAIQRVVGLHKAVKAAARVSLDELRLKKAEVERGLAQVDAEITWHDEQRLREQSEQGEGGGAAEDDQFPEVFTEFYNWAMERKDAFDEALARAERLFAETSALLGEGDAKEPHEVFDTLDKFIVRFEAAMREADDEQRAAEEQAARPARAPAKPKKQLRSRPSIVPGRAIPGFGALSIRRNNKDAAAAAARP